MAAPGDMYVSHASVASGAYLDLNPAGTEHIVIHNVYVVTGNSWSLHYYDGTNRITMDSNGPDGGLYNQFFHCKAGTRLQVRNDAGTSQLLAADGVYIKG